MWGIIVQWNHWSTCLVADTVGAFTACRHAANATRRRHGVISLHLTTIVWDHLLHGTMLTSFSQHNADIYAECLYRPPQTATLMTAHQAMPHTLNIDRCISSDRLKPRLHDTTFLHCTTLYNNVERPSTRFLSVRFLSVNRIWQKLAMSSDKRRIA